jgi:hypothetical protein
MRCCIRSDLGGARHTYPGLNEAGMEQPQVADATMLRPVRAPVVYAGLNNNPRDCWTGIVFGWFL